MKVSFLPQNKKK